MTLPRHSLPRRALILGAALGCVLSLPAAQACTPGIASVDVYDRDEGRALEVHHHRGRQYVVGQPGHEYAVRIRNCSGQRVLAVVSVDGVNVVTGETATPDQSGYVIEPYGYVTIEGWRKDLERTAAFYFSDPGDAYASRTGRPDDLGVIGVALFREREPRWVHSPEAVATPPGAASRQGIAPVHGVERRCTARHRARSSRVVAGTSRRVRAREFASRPACRDPLRPSREPRRTRRVATPASLARTRPVPRCARLRTRPVSRRVDG